ncbi:hypothetical protein C5E41_00005, partial [Nocardia nova]
MIEFPSWLEWLGAAIGMEWPHGNEDDMWALAGDWHTAAGELRDILSLMDDAKSATLAAYPSGDGQQQMIDTFDSMRHGKDSLEALVGYFDQVGDSVYGGGTQIEYTKLMFYSTLVITAADIAAVWIFPPTAPAEEAGIIVATRVAVRMMMRRVLDAMAGWAGRLAENALVRFMFRHVLLNAALGAIQDFAVQQWQVWEGHRKSIDWQQLEVTTFAAGVGGAAGGAFGEAMGKKFGNAFRNEVGDVTSKWGVNLTRAGIGAGSGLVNSVAAFGGSVGWQFASDLAHGDLDTALKNLKNTHVDWRMFSAGAITGGASALNHNFAHSHFENSPFWKLNAPRADLGNIGDVHGFTHDGTVPNEHVDLSNGNGAVPHGDSSTGTGGEPGSSGSARGGPVTNGHDSHAGAPTTTAGAHERPASDTGGTPEQSVPQDHSDTSETTPSTPAERSGSEGSSSPSESATSSGSVSDSSPTPPARSEVPGGTHDSTTADTAAPPGGGTHETVTPTTAPSSESASHAPEAVPAGSEAGTAAGPAASSGPAESASSAAASGPAASSGPSASSGSSAPGPGASTGSSATAGTSTGSTAASAASPIDARGPASGGAEAARTGEVRTPDARAATDGRAASDLGRGAATDARPQGRAGAADPSAARPAADPRMQARVGDSEGPRAATRPGTSEGERVTAKPDRADAAQPRDRGETAQPQDRAGAGPRRDQPRGTEPTRASERPENARTPSKSDQTTAPRPDRPASRDVPRAPERQSAPLRDADGAGTRDEAATRDEPGRDDTATRDEATAGDRRDPRDSTEPAQRDAERRDADASTPRDRDETVQRDPDRRDTGASAPRDSDSAEPPVGEHAGPRDAEHAGPRDSDGALPLDDRAPARDSDKAVPGAGEFLTSRDGDSAVHADAAVPRDADSGVSNHPDEPGVRHHPAENAEAATPRDDTGDPARDPSHPDEARSEHDAAQDTSNAESGGPRRRPAADANHDGTVRKPVHDEDGEDGTRHDRDEASDDRPEDQLVPGAPPMPAPIGDHQPARSARSEQPDHIGAPEAAKPATPRPESTRGRCAELALKLIRDLTGSKTIRLPERAVGPEGMTAAQVQADAGGRMVKVSDHDAIARRLSRMRKGASALVVDGYHAGPGRRVVGAHAYVMVHEGGGRVVVRDPSTGVVTDHPASVPSDLHDTHMILFDHRGRPIHPLTPEHREALARQQDPAAVRIRQALDDNVGRVHELLLRTPTGRRILGELTDRRYREHIDQGAHTDGRSGSFRRRDITAVLYAEGRGQIAQALTLAHESVHAERYLNGESPADRPLELSRDDYVREMVHEEAMASGRRFQLAAELRELGYDIAEHPAEVAYRHAYERALRGLAGPEAHEIAHEVAVDHLRNYLEHVPPNDSGRTYADHYRDIWDRAHDGARTPTDQSIRYVPDDPVVRDRIRSAVLERHIATVRLNEHAQELAHVADRVADRIPYDPTMRRDMVQHLISDQLRTIDRELGRDGLPPERRAELRRLAHDLRRMSDLVDRHHNALAEVDRLRATAAADVARRLLGDMIADAPGAEVFGDHFAVIPGEPERIMVAAAPGDHERVLRAAPSEIVERMARPGVEPEYLTVDTRHNGEIRYERVDQPGAARDEPAEPVEPQDLAAQASEAIVTELERKLAEVPVGIWAVDTLHARGVTIEHDSGGGHRYEPARNRLTLDIGGTDGEQMAALVHAAIHAERAHERSTADGVLDRDRMSREDYVSHLLDEETDAHAMEFNALAQLREAGHDIATSPLERIYRDAFTAARERAAGRDDLPGDAAARAAELDRIANQAGVDAIRPAMGDHAPDGGASYAHGYGEAWDSAHPPRDDSGDGQQPRSPAGPPEPRDGGGRSYANHYGGDTSYGIKGWVTEHGVLHVEVRVGPDTPSGRQMFRDLMNELGDGVDAIQAEWFDGGALTDNLDSFNAGVQEGLTPEEAARRTFTGILAEELGYTEVTFGDPDLPGDSGLGGRLGENSGVTVVFRHPEGFDGTPHVTADSAKGHGPERPEASGDVRDPANEEVFTGGAIRPRDVYHDDAWARAAYERFRSDDSDIGDIADNLAGTPRADGRIGFTRDEIAQLKNHLMRAEHLLRDYEKGGLTRQRFDASADIAEAWIRLRSGKPLPEDIVLLEHELREAQYMVDHPDATYAAAHDHANERFNWQDNIPGRTGERYDTLWREEDGTDGVLRPDQGGSDRGGVSVRDSRGAPGSAADHRQAGQNVPGSGRPDAGDHESGRESNLRPVSGRGHVAGEGHDPGVTDGPRRPEQSGGRNTAEPPRRGELVVDLGGEQVRMRLIADEAGRWKVESVEPVEGGQRTSGTSTEPAKPGRLRSLWHRLTSGYTGHNPKYPSGSGQDGKYQTEMTEDFGHLFDLHALETLGDHDISINYARLLKESFTLWINREHAPLLNRFTARMELQAGDHIPMRARDGREYAYWNEDADPAEVAAMHTYLRDIGLGHLVDESQPQDLPGHSAPQHGEAEAPQGNPADELRAAADRLGIGLTDISPETLRRALDTAEYQNLRRAAVIEALRDAAHRYNAEHADIPYRPQSITDHNPLGRFLKEVVIAQGDDPGLLNWRGVNNGAESGRDFDVLNVENPDERIEYDPEDESGRDQGLRTYFENALRRDQIRDERATWADLLAAELSRLEPDQLDRALNDLRDGVHERAGEIRDFADQVARFRERFPANDIRELPPQLPGEPGRLVVLDVHGDHEQTLAGALDRYPGLAARLNSGDVRAEKWTVVVDANNQAHVRHVGDIEGRAISVDVEGRQLDGLLVRDADGTWHVTQPPGEPAPVVPHARTPEHIRSVRDDLARELGLDPEQVTPELIEHELRANDLRALQIEALLDHARSSDAIESFHDLANARDRLAQTTGIDDAQHATPERVAESIADRGTRNALRQQQVEQLVKYYEKLASYLKGRGEDPAHLVEARDDLVRALGGEPEDVFPKKYSKELDYQRNPQGIDPGELTSLIRGRLRDPGTGAALTDFIRTLADTDPFTTGLRFDPATDPRVFDGEVPMHDPESLTHLREIIGDGQRLFGTPDPDRPVASGSRPNRDWARLLGHDLTDATPEQYVRAYEAYRDGKIEKHERLTPAQREQVHRELLADVRQRAADLKALAELNDRYHRAVADLPENRQARIDRLSREWAAAWTERERARSYIENHAYELRVTPEELLADDLKNGSALHDLFDELGSRTVRGENLADYRRRFEEFTRRHEALFEATRRFHDNDVRVADLDAELRAAVARDVELSEGDDGAAAAPPQGPPSKPPSSPGEGAQPPEPGGGEPEGTSPQTPGNRAAGESASTRSEPPHPGDNDTAAADSGATAPARIESPTEWGIRMRAENASWDARMAARHALRMRELADEMVARDPDGPEGPTTWAARMRADQAEWEARQAAQHADWLWKIVGDHRGPTEPAPSSAAPHDPKPVAAEPESTPRAPDPASGVDKPRPSAEVPMRDPAGTELPQSERQPEKGEQRQGASRVEGAQPDAIDAALAEQDAAHSELRRIARELGLPDHGNARDLEAAILRRIEDESAEHQATIARNDLRPDQWAAARDRAQQRLNELYGLRREMMRAARDYQAARIEERQLRAANPQRAQGPGERASAGGEERPTAKPAEQPPAGDEGSAGKPGDEEPGADSGGDDDGTGGSPAKPGGDRPGGAAPRAEAEPGAQPAPDAAGGGTDGGTGGKPPTNGGPDDPSPPHDGDGGSDNVPIPPDSNTLALPRESEPPAPHGGERPAREAWHQDGPQREHRPVTRAVRKALRDLADAGATRVRAWTRMTARAHDLGLRPDEIRREILRETIARTADAAATAPAVRSELRDLLGDLDRGTPRLEVDRRAARLGVPLPSDHQVADAIRDRLAPPAQRRAELSIELGDRHTVDLHRLERLAREFGVDPQGRSRPELQRAVRDAVNNHRDTISERRRRVTVELVDRYRTASANESARRAAAQHAAEREMLQLRAGFDDRGPRISGVSYRRFRFDAPTHMRVDGAPGERGRWVGVGAGRDPELRLPARERARHAAEGFDAVYYRLELDHNGRIWVSEHYPASTEPVAARPDPVRRPGDWIVGGDAHEHEPGTRALRGQLRDLGAELGRRNDQVDKNFAKIVQLAEHLGIDDAWRMRPRELAGAVRDLVLQRRARADELWNRADIPRADLQKFFADRRAEEARAEETESLGKALLGLLRVHDQTLVAARDRVAADAALLAARDVLAGHEGLPLAAAGRPVDPVNPKPEVARLVPGSDGTPARLVVVAPGANPDHVLDPAVRRALLGADGEFVFQQVRVDADGHIRLSDMHPPPSELDGAAHRPAELEQPRRAGAESHAPGSGELDAEGPRPADNPEPAADPQAALDATVRERAHVAADLEFWRSKVDHRADPFGDVDLSRNRWSETLRQLRGDTGRYVSDSAGPDSPDVARHEQLNPEQEREQTDHVDKLAEALDRLFHFEDRLDAIDREIHDLEQRGARHDASQAEAVRDELGRVADEHRAAVQRAKPLRRIRDELSRLLDDPARRTPENLRRLADAEDAVERAEHEIDRFNDERVALTGAWPDAVADHWRAAVGTDQTPAVRRISENVWVDHGRAPDEDGTGGRPARFIVVAGRAAFDHPDVPVRADDPDGPRRPVDDRLDAPLLDALARHPDLAPLLKDPATSIDRLSVTGELAGGDRDGAGQIRARVETMAPVEIERTGLPAHGRLGEDALPFAGDTMVRWHGADGRWHDTREGQARGFRAYQPELPRGTKLDKYWQKEVDGWRLPPKGWAAFGGTDNSHIPYRQREEKMPDGFSGTLGAEPFQNMVEPLVLRLLTDHWPELSYEQILTLSEAGRAELWWHQGPGPKPEPPPGWDEEAHHGMPLDGALYTIGKRWVQLYDMARKHPWVLGPLQRRPEIGEWVRGHTTWLPDGAFDPDHPVLRKIPVVRSFRGWKGWRAGPRIDLQPPHRPWSAADHVPPRDRVEWSTPRQDRDVARWDAVQRWADRVIGEFADDAGNADVHRIVDLLTRARDPLLDPAGPGGARLEALNLARHPDGTPLTRAELTERIQLVKDHLMRNEMWVRDHADPTGRMVKKTYDRLPHVADAWLRLTGEGDGDGRTTPYNEDLLLLDDAYVEARYLADHDDATWHDADLEAARYGYDWDTNRRRLSGHLVIRDGVPVHPDELPPDAPERDGDKTLRMSRIPYAVDAPAPDPAWLSPRERRAAEILAEAGARQRFPGLPRNPVEALKEVAVRDAGPLRALPAPGARDPLLDLLLRAGRVEQLADADPGERFAWAERLGEPESAVEPRQLPDTLRRLRGDLTRRLDDLGAAGPDEQAGETNQARPALGGTDEGATDEGGTDEGGTDEGGTDEGGTDEGDTGASGAKPDRPDRPGSDSGGAVAPHPGERPPVSGDGPLRQPGPMQPHELHSGRTEVERLATERGRLADELGRLRAESKETGAAPHRPVRSQDDTEARKRGTDDAPEGGRSKPERADDGGQRPVAPARTGDPSEGEGSESNTDRTSSGDADAAESGEKGDSRGDRAEEPRTTQPHPGGPRASGSDGDGTDAESGDGGRAGAGRRAGQQPPDGGGPDRAGGANPGARDPRKPYITPVPHVPHNAEFEWPDYACLLY